MALAHSRQHRCPFLCVLFRSPSVALLFTTEPAVNIGDLAGGTNGFINTWMVIGLTSHFYIRKYHAGWFRKYNVCTFLRHYSLVC